MERIPADHRTLSEVGFPQLGASWMDAPDERTPAFFPVFGEVSLAVQSALREYVPNTYFSDLAVFSNTKTAYPMLVYQASLPFRGKLRTDLTYDVLNPQSFAVLFRGVKVTLPELLDRLEARLQAAGSAELALKYARKQAPEIVQSVQRLNKSRKCLYILIRSEALLVNALTELGGLGGCTAKEQARRMAAFEKRWNFQLRRLYPGVDFTWLAPALLDCATEALASCQIPEPGLPLQRKLRGSGSGFDRIPAVCSRMIAIFPSSAKYFRSCSSVQNGLRTSLRNSRKSSPQNRQRPSFAVFFSFELHLQNISNGNGQTFSFELFMNPGAGEYISIKPRRRSVVSGSLPSSKVAKVAFCRPRSSATP